MGTRQEIDYAFRIALILTFPKTMTPEDVFSCAILQVLAGTMFAKKTLMTVPMAITGMNQPNFAYLVNFVLILVCPASEVTFGDSLSKLCVRDCPDNPSAGSGQPDTYYAD